MRRYARSRHLTLRLLTVFALLLLLWVIARLATDPWTVLHYLLEASGP